MIRNTLKDVEMPEKVARDGSGLSVLICCEYTFLHNWMAFASWYSINRNLPGAKVAVAVKRGGEFNSILFNWVYKCDIRFMRYKENAVPLALERDIVRKPLVVMNAGTMAVGDFLPSVLDVINERPLWVLDGKIEGIFGNDDIDTFAGCEKCGNFTVEAWSKGRVMPPFHNTQVLKTDALTLSEKKILSLWSSMAGLFDTFSR